MPSELTIILTLAYIAPMPGFAALGCAVAVETGKDDKAISLMIRAALFWPYVSLVGIYLMIRDRHIITGRREQ